MISQTLDEQPDDGEYLAEPERAFERVGLVGLGHGNKLHGHFAGKLP
jgi:hypothetical protein